MARTARWQPLALLLVAAALMLGPITRRSLWVDEAFTVHAASSSGLSGVLTHVTTLERRPPGHFLLMYGWVRLAGASDFALRLPNIGLTLLSAAAAYVLARELAGDSAALVTLALLAFSPMLHLYGPMARAYSLTLFLSLLCHITFLHWVRRPGTGRKMSYLTTSLALLYTDYTGLAVLAAHGLWLIVNVGRRRQALRPWLVGMIVLGAAYAPWLGFLLRAVSRPVLPADLARSGLGVLLKIAYPFYSFTVGETIFPWHPAAALGVICGAVAGLLGVRHLVRRNSFAFVALSFALPLLFVISLLTLIAQDIPFLNVPSRSIVALPFFVLVMAAGIMAAPRRWLGGLLLGGLLLSSVISLANLWQGTQYHNPIYAVPARQIAADVAARLQPGDVVVSEPDIVFERYFVQIGESAPHFTADRTGRAITFIEKERPARLWLITFGRDRTAAVRPAQHLLDRLPGHYALSATLGYVPQDPRYSRFKARLLGRANYPYKVQVGLWVRK